jgi:hypothetical protein
MRVTHIDIGNGAPLCGAKTTAPTLTSHTEVSGRMCKKCQRKLEILVRGVLHAIDIPKVLRAAGAVKAAYRGEG